MSSFFLSLTVSCRPDILILNFHYSTDTFACKEAAELLSFPFSHFILLYPPLFLAILFLRHFLFLIKFGFFATRNRIVFSHKFLFFFQPRFVLLTKYINSRLNPLLSPVYNRKIVSEKVQKKCFSLLTIYFSVLYWGQSKGTCLWWNWKTEDSSSAETV